MLGWLVGFVTLRFIKSRDQLEEQLVWAIPIGFALFTTLIFGLSFAIPHQDIALIVGSFLACLYVFFYFNRDSYRGQLLKEYWDRVKKLDRSEIIPWLIVLLPWLIYTAITIPRLMFWRDGNLVAGWINVWGDWSVHLRNSTFFAAQTQLSLENALFSGVQSHYPYLSGYLSSLLQRLDLDIARSLTWPTIALFGSLPAVLYIVGRRLTNNRAAGVLFTYLILLNGGLGVWYLLKDLADGHYFWQASAYGPKLYTDMFRVNGLSTNDGIWFMNFIMSEFIPQRAFLAGIGLALYILKTAWQALKTEAKIDTANDQPNRPQLVFAGLLFGLLPIIHSHSFIALGLIIPVLWLYRSTSSLPTAIRNRDSLVAWLKQPLQHNFLWLIGPATILGFGLVFLFVYDPTQVQSFFHLINWWAPETDKPVNPLLYWWRNAGPFILLGSIAFFVPNLKAWRPAILIGLILFIICNRISFQPWHYDNLKILTYWYLLWAIPISLLLTQLWRRAAIIVIALILILTGAGLADALTVTTSTRTGIQLTTKDDLYFAQLVKEATAQTPNALIAAATNHDGPLSLASGRRLYMGYEGWLWTYGLDWYRRLEELKKMYSASPEGLKLLKERQISYLVIGPQERDRYQPKEAQLLSLFPIKVQYQDYLLLEVK